MKKAWVSILLSVLIISALSFSASAEKYTDPRDSRYIPPVAGGSSNYLVKAYDCSLLVTFGNCENIEAVLRVCDIPERTVYINRGAGGLVAFRYLQNEDGRYVRQGYGNDVNYAKAVLQEFQTMEVFSAALPDAVIENVYFFYASESHEGNAIYYKTNLGDYVYYRGIWGSPEMFCTAERFFEYKRAECFATKIGGAGDIYEWDLSAYDYRSPNFDPAAPLPNSKNLPIGVAVFILTIAAIVAVYVIVHRKRTRESEEI